MEGVIKMSFASRIMDFFTKKTKVQQVEIAAKEKQEKMGKLSARERIEAILDPGTFHEYDLFVQHQAEDFGMDKKELPRDGVFTGTGKILGFPVCIYAQDFSVAGGSLGLAHASKITKIMDHAMNLGLP